MQESEIEELFYKAKKYSELKNVLYKQNDNRSFILLGQIYLREKNLKESYLCFKQANYLLGCAYCKFLNKDLSDAKKFLHPIQNKYSHAKWLNTLVDFLGYNTKNETSYFQIRNFYEQDVDMLFYYQRHEFIEKIFKNSNFFAQYNKEVYKYNGRILLNYGYLDVAEKYLKKSLDIYYNDVEVHFSLGDLYERKRDIEKAKKSYRKAIEVNKMYYPAEIRLKNLD